MRRKALQYDPFVENLNFRRAIKDFDTEDFKTYDNRIKSDVNFLISNLENKFGYTRQGAEEICIYVIDNNLSGKFRQVFILYECKDT